MIYRIIAKNYQTYKKVTTFHNKQQHTLNVLLKPVLYLVNFVVPVIVLRTYNLLYSLKLRLELDSLIFCFDEESPVKL